MSCGTGCTDCPTCRGEVQPDAPIMHDVRFAMAMAQGPLYEDGFLGPLSIAQTIRDGVRRRGGGGEGDTTILRFVDGVAEASLRTSDRGAPRMGLWRTSPREQSQCMDADACGLGRAGLPLPRGGAPVGGAFSEGWTPEESPEDRKKRQEKIPKNTELIPHPPESRKGPPYDTSLIGKGECCVLDFIYPMNLSIFKQPVADPKAPPGVYLQGVHFEATATYDPKPPCYCECCLFEQYVKADIRFMMNGRELGRWGTGEWAEDCVWLFADEAMVGEDGALRPRPGADYHKEPPPRGEDGQLRKDVLVQCYGDLWPQNDKRSQYRDKGCGFSMCDEPSQGYAPGITPVGYIHFIGQIRDRCRPPRIVRRDEFWIEFAATLPYQVAVHLPNAAFAQEPPTERPADFSGCE